jgi:hypothetical protein
MSPRVPMTDPLWQVQLAQRGLAPSPETMALARLLHEMEAMRRAEALARGAEGDDKR